MVTVIRSGRLVSTGDPALAYTDAKAEGTRVGPRRCHIEKIDQTRAIRTLLHGVPSVVYAVRFPDGVIKIGCSADLSHRIRRFRSLGGEVIGFMPGDMADEQAIHASLVAHRHHGREYYRPAPEVVAVVNDMRDVWNLPHLTP